MLIRYEYKQVLVIGASLPVKGCSAFELVLPLFERYLPGMYKYIYFYKRYPTTLDMHYQFGVLLLVQPEDMGKYCAVLKVLMLYSCSWAFILVARPHISPASQRSFLRLQCTEYASGI